MPKQEQKKAIIKRLKTIEGHLKKVTSMVEEDKYCMDVIQQTTAVKQAIRSTEVAILDEHLHSCLIKEVKKGKQKAVDELLALFKKINK